MLGPRREDALAGPALCLGGRGTADRAEGGLVDASDLTGLYRVASFLGLGIALIGIGYLYQRILFRVRA